MEEDWRPIPDHPMYLVNAEGQIKGPSGKILRPASKRGGHLYVDDSGQDTNIAVHRAVLLAFRGPCPLGMQCRHLNGDPRDNRLANLSWGTGKDQWEDDRRNEVRLPKPTILDIGEITPATAEDIKAFRQRWRLQQAELRDYLGVGPFTISRWESGSQNVRHPKMLRLALAELERRFKRQHRPTEPPE